MCHCHQQRGHAYTYTNSNVFSNANRDGDCKLNCYCYRYSLTYTDSNRQAVPDAEIGAHPKAAPNSPAETVGFWRLGLLEIARVLVRLDYSQVGSDFNQVNSSRFHPATDRRSALSLGFHREDEGNPGYRGRVGGPSLRE